jgi:hypothetical protein
MPTHALVDLQSRVGSVLTQLNLQSLSQPSPLIELPSSHSSPGSTTPSPHAGAEQLPLTQYFMGAHIAPLPSGVPGVHV